MRTLETTSDESRARAVQAELKKLLRGRDSPTKREEPPVKFEPYLLLHHAPRPLQKHILKRRVSIDKLINSLSLQPNSKDFAAKHKTMLPKLASLQLNYL